MKAGLAVHLQSVDEQPVQRGEPRARTRIEFGGLSHADGRHLPTFIAAPGTT
jgi:hypothetical protein